MVFSFSRSILLMSMWARNMMGNSNALEKRIQGLILSSPIGLDSENFLIELVFN